MDKTVLILGSTCELGNEIAIIYAKNNYDLILVAKNSKKNFSLKKKIKTTVNNQIKIKCYTLNILNVSSHSRVFKKISPKPDGVISLVGKTHNVSILKNKDIYNIINTNFTGIINFLIYFLNYFSKRKKGFVVCVTSVAGLRGRAKNFLYGSAKSGLITFLSGCRSYFSKKKIDILTVIPGYIKNKNSVKNQTISYLSTSPKKLAYKIFTAQQNKKSILYSSYMWIIIMFVIKLLPERIFKKIKF